MNSPLTENKRKSPLPPVQHEEIVVRAREFWQKAGSPAGRDLEFWLAAEHDLRLERENVKDKVAGIAAPAAPTGNELLAQAKPAKSHDISTTAPADRHDGLLRKRRL
ncbi:MAG TPA: DUF2934 domain-containing protein [Opitutaceae bacterium]|jgi:hypothetical protein|nr:DUF2934 domain-containing protein [Opitutaceae bacterium]